EGLLSELTAGAVRGRAGPRNRIGSRPDGQRNRRPASLDGYKKTFSYALGRLDRTVEPAHHNYQVRLKEFLASRGVHAEWERDYVDVRLWVRDIMFIGEIKVTGWLRLEEAFRVALGQLLEYAHLRFEKRLGMIMFFDRVLDRRRLQLATTLGIAVIAEL